MSESLVNNVWMLFHIEHIMTYYKSVQRVWGLGEAWWILGVDKRITGVYLPQLCFCTFYKYFVKLKNIYYYYRKSYANVNYLLSLFIRDGLILFGRKSILSDLMMIFLLSFMWNWFVKILKLKNNNKKIGKINLLSFVKQLGLCNKR